MKILFGLLLAAQDPALVTIQDAIAKVDGPAGYYTTTYSKQEHLYWKNIPDWIRADAASRPVGRVLDIGCGYGTLLGFAAQVYKADGFCMDVNDYMRPPFYQPRKLKFAKANIEIDAIPWTEKFDAIIMTEVLEHFNFYPVPTLVKIREALAPGGRLYLSTPDEKEWGREFKYYKGMADMPMPDRAAKFVDAHIFVYSKVEVLKLLADAGFRVEKFEYAPGVGRRHFNVVAASR